MTSTEVVFYNTCALLCALFVLEAGADKFIDHTVVVAKRTGIPPGVLALLTAGAEWEELAVVVISISRKRSSLAMGNVVGSTISNILGAFSLGLLFHKGEVVFDRSSRIYSLILLVLTGLVSALLVLPVTPNWRVLGIILVVSFTIYLASIAWAIRRGRVSAPELSDSDSDSDSDSESDDASDTNAQERRPINSSYGTVPSSTAIRPPATKRSQPRSLSYHALMLVLGFLAILLSSYVLSNAATAIIDELGLSDLFFGVVILSIATTLPEKFIAVMSGSRGQMGITVANTVGSNIFLLTLCLGITLIATRGVFDEKSVTKGEVGIMLASSALMTATVWFGAKWAKSIGAVMVLAYIAFFVVECVYHR